MIRLEGAGGRLCDGLTRRELLRFGGLSRLGLTAGADRPAAGALRSGGKARSLLFISVFGGPSHHDIWDLKPDAPAEIRGEFRPIETNVAGVRITEHLPRLARLAHRYALIRSVTHLDNGHGSAMYAAFTGWPHPMPNTNPIPGADDYPAFGSVLGHLRPTAAAIPPFICVGGTQFVCGNQIPGQRAGFLGPAAEPFVIDDDPNRPGFRVPALTPDPTIPTIRLGTRQRLLRSVEDTVRLHERAASVGAMDAVRSRAFSLLESSRIREALDLRGEPDAVRDGYGRTTFGQSLIVGRRLIEAGVPCVSVNWARGGNWDNHGNIFPSLKNQLLPPFDQSFSALLEDLTQRGLLDSTLVLCAGEFGRTPKINPGAGRDHWAGVYTQVMAGGGIQGGRVHGSSDAHGAYPDADPVGPWDIAATLYHALGVAPEAELHDRANRPLRITRGEPIHSLF